MLLDYCIRFVTVAFKSEEVFLEGDPLNLYCPTLDPPWTILAECLTHEFFIPVMFRKHPSSGSLVKADDVFSYIYMH